jgi:hypothetical protein
MHFLRDRGTVFLIIQINRIVSKEQSGKAATRTLHEVQSYDPWKHKALQVL